MNCERPRVAPRPQFCARSRGGDEGKLPTIAFLSALGRGELTEGQLASPDRPAGDFQTELGREVPSRDGLRGVMGLQVFGAADHSRERRPEPDQRDVLVVHRGEHRNRRPSPAIFVAKCRMSFGRRLVRKERVQQIEIHLDRAVGGHLVTVPQGPANLAEQPAYALRPVVSRFPGGADGRRCAGDSLDVDALCPPRGPRTGDLREFLPPHLRGRTHFRPPVALPPGGLFQTADLPRRGARTHAPALYGELREDPGVGHVAEGQVEARISVACREAIGVGVAMPLSPIQPDRCVQVSQERARRFVPHSSAAPMRQPNPLIGGEGGLYVLARRPPHAPGLMDRPQAVLFRGLMPVAGARP